MDNQIRADIEEDTTGQQIKQGYLDKPILFTDRNFRLLAIEEYLRMHLRRDNSSFS
jgi:hypothetical protein